MKSWTNKENIKQLLIKLLVNIDKNEYIIEIITVKYL